MKNNIYTFVIIILMSLLLTTKLSTEEIFNFNVSELVVTEEGNLFKGYNGGEAYTEDGISIKAENFEYNKITNILIANKNVFFKDEKKNIIITSETISYDRNKEKIIADGNVVVINNDQRTNIKANKIFYSKNKDQISAIGKVKFIDELKKINIKAEEI